MKSFPEYKDYLRQQLNHLIINNDQDLLSFTKLLLNYGKVAIRYYPQEVEDLAQDLGFYGIKEHELLNHIKEITFKDHKVFIKTKTKSYQTDLISTSKTLLKSQMDVIDMFVLLSICLDNKQQGLFQLVHFKK